MQIYAKSIINMKKIYAVKSTTLKSLTYVLKEHRIRYQCMTSKNGERAYLLDKHYDITLLTVWHSNKN